VTEADQGKKAAPSKVKSSKIQTKPKKSDNIELTEDELKGVSGGIRLTNATISG
jgi:hypothetical protein